MWCWWWWVVGVVLVLFRCSFADVVRGTYLKVARMYVDDVYSPRSPLTIYCPPLSLHRITNRIYFWSDIVRWALMEGACNSGAFNGNVGIRVLEFGPLPNYDEVSTNERNRQTSVQFEGRTTQWTTPRRTTTRLLLGRWLLNISRVFIYFIWIHFFNRLDQNIAVFLDNNLFVVFRKGHVVYRPHPLLQALPLPLPLPLPFLLPP